MGNSIDARQPGYAGVNITCNVIDPTKLPPDSPLLRVPPQCTVSDSQGQKYNPPCYDSSYYINGNRYNNPYNSNQHVGNTRKKRVTKLTDNYIKNLESYLNNPNEELRKYAAQEVIKRFDEDKSRYDDAALNALLNKMLQDPACHRVKSIALTALETQLAQGNQNTVNILQNMVLHDKSRGGADALKAERILLRMSAPTEVINVPCNQSGNKEIDVTFIGDD